MILRCPGNKVHGEILVPGSGGVIEFKCGSRWCGAYEDVVVLHQFSMHTGELLFTNRYKDPSSARRKAHGTSHAAAVRDP